MDGVRLPFSTLPPRPYTLFITNLHDIVDVVVPFCVSILLSRPHALFVEILSNAADGVHVPFPPFHLVHIPRPDPRLPKAISKQLV